MTWEARNFNFFKDPFKISGISEFDLPHSGIIQGLIDVNIAYCRNTDPLEGSPVSDKGERFGEN